MLQRGGQKTLHPRLVVETLAEEIAPVPAQENVADVKDDDQGRSPLGRDIIDDARVAHATQNRREDTGRARESGRLADAVAIWYSGQLWPEY